MQELLKTLGVVRERIEGYALELTKNEALVRYALVDPLLRELDWDLSNPAEVIPEERDESSKRTDYSMCRNSMIVETKRLDTNLDKHIDKLVEYVTQRKVRYGVLTDGQRWKMYDVQDSFKTPTMDVDITDLDGIVLPKLMKLHKSAVLSRIPEDTPSDQEPKDWVLLPEITYSTGANPPTKIEWSGKNIPIISWVDVLASVAKWLINAKYINKTNCPITSGPKNSIINTTPVHQNGRKFVSSKEIQGFYVEKNVQPKVVIRHAIRLIKIADLEPTDFKVYFKNS